MAEFAVQPSRRALAQWLGSAALLSLARPLGRARAAESASASASTRSAGPVLLNANENPYGPPPAALAALRDALTDANRYPDARDESLRKALARSHGAAPECIVLGCGSSQILHGAAAAFAPAGSAVVAA